MEIEHPVLEIGEVYYVTTWFNKGKFYMIGRVEDNNIKSSGGFTARCKATYLSINNMGETNKLKVNTNWAYCEFGFPNQRNYRKATKSEIVWLDKCINAGRYVTKPLSVSDFIFKNGVCSSSG